jgi:hypothetical protein
MKNSAQYDATLDSAYFDDAIYLDGWEWGVQSITAQGKDAIVNARAMMGRASDTDALIYARGYTDAVLAAIGQSF